MSEETHIAALAAQAMTLARNHIVMRLRFMDMAVFRLRPAPADTTLATEGAHLFYGEKHVLRRYMRVEQQGLARDYLHVLLHCVFRHPFIATLVDQSRWDLACDIAVNGVILAMDDPHFALPDDGARQAVLDALKVRIHPLTAEKLYRYFEECPPEPAWHALFRADDHVLWHKPKKARALENAERREGDGGEDGGGAPPSRPNPPPPEAEDAEPGETPGRADGEQGEDAPAGDGAIPEPEPPEPGAEAASRSAAGDPGEDREGGQRTLRAEASEGKTGRAMGEIDEHRGSDQRNRGRGMDTEGREGMPAGSQSRNDRTDGGLDSARSLGTGGDAGDARSQSGASDTGGSGAGLNDGLLAPGDDAASPADDYEEDRRDDDRDRLEREWRDVGERIQTDLETFSRRMGGSAGGLREQLEALNRERIDYAGFLRRFTVLGESAELNPEEFDPIYYTYGLKLYGNLPLIEPQETREVMRVRDFVIAIDTSGSTSGALVKRFIEKTWAILKGEENFFKRMNLYIVQCDAEVRDVVRIDSQRAFDAYMEGFAVKGLGGTDFRPVFLYVDDLLAQGAFTHLKGLIYFTDGIGTYPARKPGYETAFVFVGQDGAGPAVPPWAIRVVLEEDF